MFCKVFNHLKELSKAALRKAATQSQRFTNLLQRRIRLYLIYRPAPAFRVMSVVLTNVARPRTSATLTVRIIKSFQFRTERSLVLHDINLDTTTVGQLKDTARQGKMSSQVLNYPYQLHWLAVLSLSGWKPYRNVVLGESPHLHFFLLSR